MKRRLTQLHLLTSYERSEALSQLLKEVREVFGGVLLLAQELFTL